MEDVDINPFEDHVDPDETDDMTPLLPIGGIDETEIGGGIQETDFIGTQNTRLLKLTVEALYKKLDENMTQNPSMIHSDLFELKDSELYYKRQNRPLTSKGKFRRIGIISDILGKTGLRDMGFQIPITRKITARQAVLLNEVEDNLPSTSRVSDANNIELETITSDLISSTEDIISMIKVDQQVQTGDTLSHPLRELLGLDKQLTTIRGSLRVEIAKTVKLK